MSMICYNYKKYIPNDFIEPKLIGGYYHKYLKYKKKYITLKMLKSIIHD